MDFDPTPEMADAAALAAGILADRCTQTRLREVEATGTRFDPELWTQLGAAGLLGLPLPEDAGGSGLGLLELCSVLVEVGRAVAPVPAAWHVPSAMALARFAPPARQRQWLPRAVAGEVVLTTALSEDRAFAPDRPTTTADRDGERWVLSGAKTVVPAGTIADLFLVPADSPAGTAVFLVRPDDVGVTVEPQVLNDGDTVARLELTGVSLDDDRVLGSDPAERAQVSRWLTPRLMVALCAQQLGVVEEALALTAGYARTREQFGRPIGSFQAVSQRLADGYIDVQGARLTLWQAAWRLAEGLPADVEVASAKLWAADTGHKLAHTAVHVHGGVGIDLEGPAHRYFTAAKRHELALGGGTEQARHIGRALAADPA
jgi:alkylation response protein AidB-like acyl-CoA dehydrogenase